MRAYILMVLIIAVSGCSNKADSKWSEVPELHYKDTIFYVNKNTIHRDGEMAQMELLMDYQSVQHEIVGFNPDGSAISTFLSKTLLAKGHCGTILRLFFRA